MTWLGAHLDGMVNWRLNCLLPPGRARTQVRAFTLIELMLVLVLLTIVISLVMPSLSKFFGGRTLDSEVRRFLALTRYGQSRAASEGVPMLLWVDAKAGKYGLQEEPGYTDKDPKAEDFKVGDGVTIAIGRLGSKTPATSKRYGLHFSPEGSIVTATSVSGISLKQGTGNPVWIVPAGNGLNYEVQK